jgi:hypothetical protein
MAAWFAHFDSEHSIEQEYALVKPSRQITVSWWCHTQIARQFGVHIPQRPWQRANFLPDTER